MDSLFLGFVIRAFISKSKLVIWNQCVEYESPLTVTQIITSDLHPSHNYKNHQLPLVIWIWPSFELLHSMHTNSLLLEFTERYNSRERERNTGRYRRNWCHGEKLDEQWRWRFHRKRGRTHCPVGMLRSRRSWVWDPCFPTPGAPFWPFS